MREFRAVEAVIFDLDGTLVDSAPDIHTAAAKLLTERGHASPDLSTVKGFVGNGVAALVERLLDWAGETQDATARQAATLRFHQIYQASPAALSRPFDSVPQTLQSLAGAGYRLGLCTNKPLAPARAVLAQLGLADPIEAVVGGDSLPVRKPDAEPLLHVARALGASPEAIVYVGDSEVDSATAQAAGIAFALFTEGYRKSPPEQIPHHARFAHFAELQALLERFPASPGI
ncbi:phosphoglycolate phosphatase [Pelagibius sp.]|uniref:phosphoglycolate phosphatase n=1 Tax=Pelagibius sp. TaxID=1931238 RepID=UPI003B51437C